MPKRPDVEPKKRYIIPFPKHQLYAGMVSAVLGLILFIIGLQGHRNTDTLPIVFRGFGVTLITVSFLGLLPEVIRYALEHKERKLFLLFFGQTEGRSPLILVSAGRVVAPDKLEYLVPDPVPDVARGATPEGVKYWMAGEDIRASSYLSQTLAIQDVPVSIDVTTAVKARRRDFSSVSLGLGFNDHTLRLADIHQSKLFGASFCRATVSGKDVVTDFITIGGEDPGQPTLGNDFALVCRIIDENKPTQIHFVSTGRSAQGTAVAGYFLARKNGSKLRSSMTSTTWIFVAIALLY